MNILQTIIDLDNTYTPDSDAIIAVDGMLPTGQEVEMWIVTNEDGPELWPGAWFLGYGGVYYCPLISSIREQE